MKLSLDYLFYSNQENYHIKSALSLLDLLNKVKYHIQYTSLNSTILHHHMHLHLYATAGLRLIGEDKANKILSAVNKLFDIYQFNISSYSYYYKILNAEIPMVSGVIKPNEIDSVPVRAEMLSGDMEGIYGWYTINYLLSTLNSYSASSKLVSALDMGGGFYSNCGTYNQFEK